MADTVRLPGRTACRSGLAGRPQQLALEPPILLHQSSLVTEHGVQPADSCDGCEPSLPCADARSRPSHSAMLQRQHRIRMRASGQACMLT